MIITLTQAKALLKITGSTNDTLISALIPEAEAKYLQIRNFPFLQIQADYKSGDKTLSNIILYPYSNTINCSFNYTTPVKYLNRFDYITNSVIDNYITDINIYDDTVEIDTAPSTTATSALFTVYPQGAKLTAAKLIQYLMNSNSMNGLQSESVGSYSWSKGSTGNPYGVPDDIFRSIKRYVTA
jgi:hypothetical protein